MDLLQRFAMGMSAPSVFEEHLRCYSAAVAGRPELEEGGKSESPGILVMIPRPHSWIMSARLFTCRSLCHASFLSCSPTAAVGVDASQ